MTITPRIALPSVALDLAAISTTFAHYFLLLEKSTETAATRAERFNSSVHQIVCRLKLHPRLHRGAYSATTTP